ncbi:hypothetical protein GQ53DRAFT_761133 [Thozetella sp. PMI_491]|nr:hypothetical protein GQ53DRAFT_761133 [Thozetella sp. PMI_491]
MHAHGTLANASILTIVSLSTSKTAVIHVVPQTTADVVVFCVIYIVEIICAAWYTRSARSLRSRWAQLGAVLIQLTGPVVCALALARLAHANVENVPPLAYPLPASIHGLALSLYFLDTIDRSSRDLTTSLQLSRAIRQVRLRTLSMTSQQVLLVLLLSKIASSGLAHYCKFTILSFLSSLLFYLAFFCPFTIQNTSLLSERIHTPVAKQSALTEGDAVLGCFNLYLWIGVAALSSLVSVRLMSRDALLDFPSEGDAAVGQANISYASFLPQAHVLDVFRLASGPRPFLVSIGFDRRVVLWDLDSQTVSSQRIMCDPSDGFIWPISAASMDSGAKWLAMCTHGGQVVVWSREQSRVCLSMSAGGRLASCLFARMTSQDPLHGPSTHLLLVLEDGVLIDRNIETAKVVTTQICDGRVVSAHVVSKPRTSTQLIAIAEGGQLFLSARREGQWFTRRMQIGAPVAGPVKSSRIALVPALRGFTWPSEELVDSLDSFGLGQPIHSFRGCSIQFQTLRALHSPPQNCVHCGSTAVTSFSVAYTDQSGPFVMRTMSAENDRRYHTGMICLRSERDVRERRCSTFTPGREVTHVLPDPGVWEASGANAVAGLRKSKSSKQSAGSDIDKMLHRRNSTQRISREGWEAWTMTAKGITNRQSLTASLVTPRTGPACKLARNAVAIGLADLIVLVRFGDRIYAEDEEEGLANKPSHGRLSRQNSQIGRLRRP